MSIYTHIFGFHLYIYIFWLIRPEEKPYGSTRHEWYEVATISRLPENIGLFCKRALENRWYSTKETYHFKEPTNRSHPIRDLHTKRDPYMHTPHPNHTVRPQYYLLLCVYTCDMTHPAVVMWMYCISIMMYVWLPTTKSQSASLVLPPPLIHEIGVRKETHKRELNVKRDP